jgi:hypothetical protein
MLTNLLLVCALGGGCITPHNPVQINLAGQRMLVDSDVITWHTLVYDVDAYQLTFEVETDLLFRESME